MMKNKIKNILNDFIRDGFVEFNSLLDKRDCSRLYNRIKNSRDWGPKLFNSEKKRYDVLFFDNNKADKYLPKLQFYKDNYST